MWGQCGTEQNLRASDSRHVAIDGVSASILPADPETPTGRTFRPIPLHGPGISLRPGLVDGIFRQDPLYCESDSPETILPLTLGNIAWRQTVSAA